MRRMLVPLLALTAALTATVTPLARPAPALPGPGAVIEMHSRLFRAIDAGDAERAASFVGPDAKATLFLDRSGARVDVIAGRREVVGRLSAWARESKGLGFETRLEPVRADCPSGDLSYAVLEIERRRETESGTEVERYVSTSLVQHRDGGWKLLHWHLSPADGPGEKMARK